jgi:hypothetical protein
MHAGIRLFHDTPEFVFAMQRIEVGALPTIARMPGFRMMGAFRVDGTRGIGLVVFDHAYQLADAVRYAEGWSYRLDDLKRAIMPTRLFMGEPVFFQCGPIDPPF